MVPGYTDISHFRAPYKNAYPYTGISGFGQDPAAAVSELVVVGGRKGPKYKPATAKKILESLKGMRAIFLSPTSIAVAPLTPAERAAAAADPNARAMLESSLASKWVDEQLALGHIVFAKPGVAIAGASEPELLAVPQADRDQVVMAAHVAPILAEPSMLSKLATPGGIAVVAIGAAAGFYLLRRRRRRV